MAVFWWNAAGALAAAIANTWAAVRGDPRMAPVRTAIAALAAFYLLGYLLVTLGGWDQQAWGAFYRKASIIVWPVVWCGPAVLGVLTYKRTTRALTNLGEKS